MSTWDKVALRFIAFMVLVVTVAGAGYYLRTRDWRSEDQKIQDVKSQNDAILNGTR